MWPFPYDAWSVAALAACAGLLIAASRPSVSTPVRVGLLLLVATILRVDAAWQWSVYPWDERFHALVAKHLMADPLRPALYPPTHLDLDPNSWQAAGVWLHKPPLALWLIALSYSAFGVNELALRLPSIVAGVGAVFLTYRIAAVIFDTRVALLAAAFHAVNGFLISQVAGRRAADHVDVWLVCLVELGVLVIVSRGERSDRRMAVLCGVAAGAATLAKSLPGLLPIALLALAPHPSLRGRTAGVALATLAAAVVAAPWFVYTAYQFPAASALEWRYTFQHLSQTLEGQAGPWWSYAADMPRFFGELLPVALVWFAWTCARLPAAPHHRLLAAWVTLPYAVFSASATKLPNLIMLAAPALFVIYAAFWCWLRAQPSAPRLAGIRAGLLVLAVLLPGRYLLEPSGPFEARERRPASTEALRQFDASVATPDAVLFNVPDPVVAMFYSRFPAYARLPTALELQQLRARGVTVAIYIRDGERDLMAPWPSATR